MSSDTFSLPAFKDPDTRIIWRLDTRGLEWTKDEKRGANWMPFACIRLATLGHRAGKGWCLRLSGPPGAITICSGPDRADDLQVFTRLSRAMILGAQATGCPVRFRLNPRAIGPDWLWARLGRAVDNGTALVTALQYGPESC